jgi:LPS export ABC transporter permease LptG/LPS export ABC transporter permease LptF
LGCVLFTSVLFLESSRKLFEFVASNSGPAATIAYLFALVLPQSLPFTIPLGVLLGTLVTLSRKSADGEITAMRASGVPGWRVTPAVLAFAVLGLLVAASASIFLKPWSIRDSYRVRNDLVANKLTAEIQPRVFEERFPDTVLFVTDTSPTGASTALWKKVIIADMKPSADHSDIPAVTLASEVIASPEPADNRIRLALKSGSNYDLATKDITRYEIRSFAGADQSLTAERPKVEHATRPTTEMDIGPLYKAAYKSPELDKPDILDARIELHQRIALPFACIVLAFAGIPLGITSRRSGKSSSVVLTASLALFYYMTLISMTSLAQQATLPPELAMWVPNLVFLALGVFLMSRLEKPAGHDRLGPIGKLFGRAPAAPVAANQRNTASPSQQQETRMSRLTAWRVPLVGQIVDTYLISRFLSYFFLLLATFVVMIHVFRFFELLSDVIKNHIPLERVLSYLFFLTPRMIYEFTPISVLTSVLVVFGILAKSNEITALKACGVSVYRLTVPVLLTSLGLSAALFAFDHYLVPDADRRQDAILAEIKGRPPQTFNPTQRWIYGMGDRIYFYRYFNQTTNVMGGVSIFEIEPTTFTLKRQIAAASARWEPALATWVFENGWSRDMNGKQFGPFDDFTGQARTFKELAETPDYFVKENIQSQQMNYHELKSYIQELQRSGFDTVRLQVQYFNKFSRPLFAFILALVSVPFAFQSSGRGSGAMAGFGISLGIFVVYWSARELFEQVGNLGQLDPVTAAWAPDGIFVLAGIYLLARVRS